MIKVGIIGAENSHCAAISKLCNVERSVLARVVAVWGETAKFAEAAAKTGQVPTIVRDWRDMVGLVDGVMIDHRHPARHAEVATYYVKHGVPVFVDKPFTFTRREGMRLCRLAERENVPIMSFSVLPLQKSLVRFKRALGRLGEIVSLTSTGPIDIQSKWGGIFFYGIHQVDAIVELLGTDVDAVELKRHGSGGLAILTYRNGPMATMNCINNGNSAFHFSAVGDRDILDCPLSWDDNIYRTGARLFVDMFHTGKEPFTHERMLAPVAILEAMQKSVSQGGKRVKVHR